MYKHACRDNIIGNSEVGMLEEGTSVRILVVNFRGDGVPWQSAGIAIVALVEKFVACLLHTGRVV